jgi:hypothetical protein
MAEDSRDFRVELSEATEACRRAIRACDFEIVRDDLPSGALEARSGATILSWGEAIFVSIRSQGGTVRITCESQPTKQVFDWGKSSGNVAAFFRALAEHLG